MATVVSTLQDYKLLKIYSLRKTPISVSLQSLSHTKLDTLLGYHISPTMKR